MRRKNVLVFGFLVFLSILFQGCREDKTQGENGQPMTSLPDTTVAKARNAADIKYQILVERIDSLQYYFARSRIRYSRDSTARITDSREAAKLLKGIVEFGESRHPEEPQPIRSIHFRNGTEYENRDEFDYISFVAYFPQEDILLCEGGHTSDVSFNLKNGKETEETGNPDYMVYSPGAVFRLNGYFGGQECSAGFIERKIGADYVNVIQLDEEFEKITQIWLCIIGESFWTNERTLFLTEASDFTAAGLNNRYFKVTIIEQ